MAHHSEGSISISCFIQSQPAIVGSPTGAKPSILRCTVPHRSLHIATRRHQSLRDFPRSCAEAADFAPLSLSSDAPPPQTYEPEKDSISVLRIVNSLWQFTRPHTFYGTFLSVTSITTLALRSSPFLTIPRLLPTFLTALIPALLINVYITGLNQLHDVEIDKINKPFLPLPAGLMTKNDAAAVIIMSLLSGLAFCFVPLATTALRAVLIGSTILGTLYSMPPFRLKRFAVLASVAILTVRGFLVNVGFFLHATAITGVSTLPPLVVFATAFFTIFGIVIALLKDAPDIRGDRTFGIRTFSVQLGARTVFSFCAMTLVCMFSIAAVYYFRTSKTLFGGILAALTHLLVAFVLAKRALSVDVENSEDIYRYYMFSWKTFYLEYLLLPLATL